MDGNRRTRILSALFAATVALAIAGMWTITLVTDAMAELHTAPWTAYAHLAAEFLTALLLAAGAYGLVCRRPWGVPLHLLGLGMMLYAVVQATGYFVQNGPLPMVAFFSLLALLALLDFSVWAARLATSNLHSAA